MHIHLASAVILECLFLFACGQTLVLLESDPLPAVHQQN